MPRTARSRRSSRSTVFNDDRRKSGTSTLIILFGVLAIVAAVSAYDRHRQRQRRRQRARSRSVFGRYDAAGIAHAYRQADIFDEQSQRPKRQRGRDRRHRRVDMWDVDSDSDSDCDDDVEEEEEEEEAGFEVIPDGQDRVDYGHLPPRYERHVHAEERAWHGVDGDAETVVASAAGDGRRRRRRRDDAQRRRQPAALPIVRGEVEEWSGDDATLVDGPTFGDAERRRGRALVYY